MKKLLLAALAALLLAGCATTYGTKMDSNKLAQLKPGVTTIADAEALMGAPTAKNGAPDGTTTLVYAYNVNATDPKLFIPIVGGMLAKPHYDSELTHLQFDSHGRYMKSWTTSTGTPAGAPNQAN